MHTIRFTWTLYVSIHVQILFPCKLWWFFAVNIIYLFIYLFIYIWAEPFQDTERYSHFLFFIFSLLVLENSSIHRSKGNSTVNSHVPITRLQQSSVYHFCLIQISSHFITKPHYFEIPGIIYYSQVFLRVCERAKCKLIIYLNLKHIITRIPELSHFCAHCALTWMLGMLVKVQSYRI